ncbi:hypothetical protein Nham_1998 [Nitrobacter hamburgensis X14]|uniref:Uncharacterized protein n=1 Tax=Nitrobacter hamburgensis (strain DSM 10229 / NCIMB 13809 / X14) TaxID=323097 RepID=Q1QLV0_NITHX|nr:hypothetical protein Nham_1998 [Nitrobacter hamburgensis X14]
MTTNQPAVRQLFAVSKDGTGNLPSMPGIFRDYLAPVIRDRADGRGSRCCAGACRRPEGPNGNRQEAHRRVTTLRAVN